MEGKWGGEIRILRPTEDVSEWKKMVRCLGKLRGVNKYFFALKVGWGQGEIMDGIGASSEQYGCEK